MADWYVSSAAYAAITAFAPSIAYTVGQIRKPTAPALKAQWVFRCTTAGTASTEPAWPTGNNATVTTGGAVFTNVTGQSAYFWTAAAGDLATIMTTGNRLAGGDRVFLSSDHTETQTNATNYGTGTSGPAGYSLIQFICVNRAGSTPPVAADVTTGAVVSTNSGNLTFQSDSPCYHYGITYSYAGVANGSLTFNFSAGGMHHYFRNCLLYLNTTATNCKIFPTASLKVTLDNTQTRFGATGHQLANNISQVMWDFVWKNTASAIQGTSPSVLFLPANTTGQTTCRGVDLSAITGTLIGNSSAGGHKYLFDSCRIASGVVRLTTAGLANSYDEVELVNCYDGTHFIAERYQPGGAVTTEFTITLSGGAQDDVGTFAHKMVSGANIDKNASTLDGFWLDVENTAIGSSKTATVEIISSLTLNNDEISLLLEYQGTSSSSLTSFATSLPATPLTTAAAVTISTATWNSSPATPVKQKLQVTFTPQVAGRVRGQVRLGRASTTVYYDPVITIT